MCLGAFVREPLFFEQNVASNHVLVHQISLPVARLSANMAGRKHQYVQSTERRDPSNISCKGVLPQTTTERSRS